MSEYWQAEARSLHALLFEKDAEIERLAADRERLNSRCHDLTEMIGELRAELAAEREQAAKWKHLTHIGRVQANIEVAAEREQWEQGIRRELSGELAEEVIAAIRKGEPPKL